jgi:hypothetical protein
MCYLHGVDYFIKVLLEFHQTHTNMITEYNKFVSYHHKRQSAVAKHLAWINLVQDWILHYQLTKNHKSMRFEVHTVVLLQIQAFWTVVLLVGQVTSTISNVCSSWSA